MESVYWVLAFTTRVFPVRSLKAKSPASCIMTVMMTLLSLHHHHHHHHRRHLSLTARVVGAPQMISLPVSFIFPVLHCPLGLAELQACPFPDVVFPPLPLSSLSSSPLSLCLARWFWPDLMNERHDHTTAVASLYDGQVFVQSDCLLDLGTDFLVGNVVFVWNAQHLAVAPHFHGSYSSLQLCCEYPWFTSTQDDGCDEGADQLYLGTEKNAPVVPNWLWLANIPLGNHFFFFYQWQLFAINKPFDRRIQVFLIPNLRRIVSWNISDIRTVNLSAEHSTRHNSKGKASTVGEHKKKQTNKKQPFTDHITGKLQQTVNT